MDLAMDFEGKKRCMYGVQLLWSDDNLMLTLDLGNSNHGYAVIGGCMLNVDKLHLSICMFKNPTKLNQAHKHVYI